MIAIQKHIRTINAFILKYSIRVIPHPSSAIAVELFNWIRCSDVEDKKTVIVFPNSRKNIYVTAAEMCSKFNVSRRNIHAFCMDEYADEDGKVAPISWYRSLGGHFMTEFYMATLTPARLRKFIEPDSIS